MIVDFLYVLWFCFEMQKCNLSILDERKSSIWVLYLLPLTPPLCDVFYCIMEAAFILVKA